MKEYKREENIYLNKTKASKRKSKRKKMKALNIKRQKSKQTKGELLIKYLYPIIKRNFNKKT